MSNEDTNWVVVTPEDIPNPVYEGLLRYCLNYLSSKFDYDVAQDASIRRLKEVWVLISKEVIKVKYYDQPCDESLSFLKNPKNDFKNYFVVYEDGTEQKLGNTILGNAVNRANDERVKKNNGGVINLPEGKGNGVDVDDTDIYEPGEKRIDDDVDFEKTHEKLQQYAADCIDYFYNKILVSKNSYRIKFYSWVKNPDQSKFTADYCVRAYNHKALEDGLVRELYNHLGVESVGESLLCKKTKEFERNVDGCFDRKVREMRVEDVEEYRLYLINEIERLKDEQEVFSHG